MDNSAFYHIVYKPVRMRHTADGARKRDCRSIANVGAVPNAVDAAISHSGKGRLLLAHPRRIFGG
jgi:hypothetical protein